MERLTDDAQWIILLGFIISVSIFFLALIINESVLVGQTTAESVLDLPKSDIHDLRNEVLRSAQINAETEHLNGTPSSGWEADLRTISISRKNSVVNITVPSYDNWPYPPAYSNISIHFNNGVTNYNEIFYY